MTKADADGLKAFIKTLIIMLDERKSAEVKELLQSIIDNLRA